MFKGEELKELPSIPWDQIKMQKVREAIINACNEIHKESHFYRGDVIVVDEQLYHLCQLNKEQNLIDGVSADLKIIRKRMFFYPIMKVVFFGSNLHTESMTEEGGVPTRKVSVQEESNEDIIKEIDVEDLI